jgi:hypothetical protein
MEFLLWSLEQPKVVRCFLFFFPELHPDSDSTAATNLLQGFSIDEIRVKCEWNQDGLWIKNHDKL